MPKKKWESLRQQWKQEGNPFVCSDAWKLLGLLNLQNEDWNLQALEPKTWRRVEDWYLKLILWSHQVSNQLKCLLVFVLRNTRMIILRNKKKSCDRLGWISGRSCDALLFEIQCFSSVLSDWQGLCVPNSPFSMTSNVVQRSSALKVTFFILSAVSASSVGRMLGETYRKNTKKTNWKRNNRTKWRTLCI